MISIFYLALISIPIIAITSGFSELKKNIQNKSSGNNKIRTSLLPEISDIFIIMILSGFVIAYSCGSSG